MEHEGGTQYFFRCEERVYLPNSSSRVNTSPTGKPINSSLISDSRLSTLKNPVVLPPPTSTNAFSPNMNS